MNIFDHKRSFATPFYLKKTENQITMDDLEINTEIESYFKKIYNEAFHRNIVKEALKAACQPAYFESEVDEQETNGRGDYEIVYFYHKK